MGPVSRLRMNVTVYNKVALAIEAVIASSRGSPAWPNPVRVHGPERGGTADDDFDSSVAVLAADRPIADAAG
jgi:hypothetical protein